MYEGLIELDDNTRSDHFENIQVNLMFPKRKNEKKSLQIIVCLVYQLANSSVQTTATWLEY